METEVETIVLDNNQEYIKLAELVINNIKYYLLNNMSDSNDFVIRKEIGEEL